MRKENPESAEEKFDAIVAWTKGADNDPYAYLTDWEVNFLIDNEAKQKEMLYDFSAKQSEIIYRIYEKLWQEDVL